MNRWLRIRKRLVHISFNNDTCIRKRLYVFHLWFLVYKRITNDEDFKQQLVQSKEIQQDVINLLRANG